MSIKYTVNAVSEAQNQSQSLFRYLSPELIQPNPKQPRRSIESEALATLKESIRERGILQPLLVMRGEDGNYILVAGQRRLAAARELGLVRVPVMMLNEIRPDYLVDSLLENIQREELSGIDEGHSFITLKEEFGWSQREIANRIHKHESYVSERIRTAEKLTAITKEIISEAFAANENLARAKFSHSINRKLALLRAEEQEELARLVASTPDITARKVEGLVREKMLPHLKAGQLDTRPETQATAKPEHIEPPEAEEVKKPARPRKRVMPPENNAQQLSLAGVLPGGGFEVPPVQEPAPKSIAVPARKKLTSQETLLVSYNPANLDPAMTNTFNLLQLIASGKRVDLEDLIQVIKEDCQNLKSVD
jgi:ParB/RepB/Spo0J family partition protein